MQMLRSACSIVALGSLIVPAASAHTGHGADHADMSFSLPAWLGHIFSSLPIYAISEQAAASLERFDRVHIADVPREDALIDLVLADC